MSGQKKKWFFLRGLVREAGHWSGFLEKFAEAFPDCEPIPLDIPGNGRHFQKRSPISVPKMAQSMREEFLARRGESNYVFALSLGAMVALEWLHSWPGDFDGAVLVNTSVRGISPLYHRLHPRNYSLILRMMLSDDLYFVEKNILNITSNRRECFERLAEDWVKIQKERPVSSMNAIRQLLAAARFHPPRQKPAVPTLILSGAGDRLVDPTCSQALARHWSLEAKVHPSAGHDLTLDEPAWVLAQLKDWQGSLP